MTRSVPCKHFKMLCSRGGHVDMAAEPEGLRRMLSISRANVQALAGVQSSGWLGDQACEDVDLPFMNERFAIAGNRARSVDGPTRVPWACSCCALVAL